MKKKSAQGTIQNRRARFDYNVEETYVAGLVLTGAETKALRLGRGQLHGAYVTVKEGELWLINAKIIGDGKIRIPEQGQDRARKLLIKKKELELLQAAKQQGRTIVPLELLTRGRYIKVRIAIAKGKKKYDKRQTIKKRDQDREARRSMS